ncbi:hypothetical protein [Streptomyces sp. DSM 118878]
MTAADTRLTVSGAVPARAVAAELGIDDVRARCSREEKAELMRRMRADGRRVAVIGDGVQPRHRLNHRPRDRTEKA